MNKKNKKKRIWYILSIILLTVIFCIWQNNDIVITNIEYSNDKITEDFNGYRILQVSDLHNKECGKNQSRLLKKIRKSTPDIIVVTGDLIDSNHTDIDVAMEFIEGAVKIAPVYYVSGNHEAWSGGYEELKQRLEEAGVLNLDDSKTEIVLGNSSITLVGVEDPAFMNAEYGEGSGSFTTEEQLDSLVSDKESFQILLSHRPELIELYAAKKVDLVFTGHAHGGQFRIPYLAGLVAPGQGYFPKYTSGSYNVADTTEIVSRGIGNSIIPVRVFNRPEVVVVTLQKK